jgi:hypothetical protein
MASQVIYLSKTFATRLDAEQLSDALDTVELQPRLRALIAAPLVRRGGAVVLEPLVANSTGAEAFADRTAYEAFINKVHVDDLVETRDTRQVQLGEMIRQGGKAAFELSRRLEREGRFRVLLSLDADLPGATLRFFGRRDGETWGADDPDDFQLEEILMIDTGR